MASNVLGNGLRSLLGSGLMNCASFLGSGDLGVKQGLCEIPDIIPGGCEAKVAVREVASAEVTGDHRESSSEYSNDSFHSSIVSFELSGMI